MDSYNIIKRALASGFMHVLDEIRPENKMCLSNGECADIDRAFDEQDWPKLERYLRKYSKPFEEQVEDWRKEAMAEY